MIKTAPILTLLIFLFLASYFMLNKDKSVDKGETYERPPNEQRYEGRAELEYLYTHDPRTNIIPKERLLEAKQYTRQLFSSRAAISNVFWQERGPNNVAGRKRAILVYSSDPSGNKIFAGGVSGGLWKSLDGGASWTQLDDFLENLAISCITQDPNNPNIIYFGTGEGFGNLGSVRGLGIWKSTDGGNTFAQLSSTNNNTEFHYVTGIVAKDVSGSTQIFATTNGEDVPGEGGVYKSTNGGNTWSQVLAGVNGDGKDIIIASTGDIVAGLGGFSGPDGIYLSSDNGATWSKIYDSASTDGRIELAASESTASIFAIVEFSGAVGQAKIIKNTIGEPRWRALTTPTWFDQNCATPGADWTRGQDWYDLAIAVDPNDEDRIFIGGIDVFETTNGGRNWTQISGWAGSCGRQYVHADQHAIVFAPGSSDLIYFGNDGGVFKTVDGSAVLPSVNFSGDGYNVTQFYACAIHPDDQVDYYLAGSQDNGTQQFLSSGINSTNEATGGDGGFCHIDQSNSNIQITSFTGNNLNVSTNGGLSFSYIGDLGGGLFINPTDYDNLNQALYAGRSNGSYIRWTDPATGGAATEIVFVSEIEGSTTHVRASDNVSGTAYFGTNRARVVRVANANTGSTTKTGDIIFDVGQGTISCVEIEEGNEDHMVVTLSNYGVVSVHETTNGTSASPSWTVIEGNLPDIPVRWALFNPLDADQILLATELGVWSTDDSNGASTDWQPTNANFANVRVDMLQKRMADNTIIAASYGRGLFSTESFTDRILIDKTAVSTAEANDTILYTITVTNNKRVAVNNVSVVDSLPAGLFLIPGSFTCGTEGSNVVTISLPTMSPSQSITCTYEAVVDINSFSQTLFEDDIESGTANWTVTNGQGTGNWSTSNSNPNSGTESWFSPNVGTEDNTQYLELAAQTISANNQFAFWHDYNTEFGWDGGFVEYSTDNGATWIDLGPMNVSNGYNSVLGQNQNNDIANRDAFSGSSNGYILSSYDLSSLSGQSVAIRFVFGEDDNTNEVGWFIDDIQIIEPFSITNVACLSTSQGDAVCDDVSTLILECQTNCVAPIIGCPDPLAHNYNANAQLDDGSCETCTDGILNGDETGIDCGGALCIPCFGCTDALAHNFDPNALTDDGSCETCSDGVMNGDETGIDCGGSNPNCPLCDCTDNTLLYTGPFNIPNNTHKRANDWITMDGMGGSVKLPGTRNASFIAKNFIEVLPEFEVNGGATILLDIDNCNPSNLPLHSPTDVEKK